MRPKATALHKIPIDDHIYKIIGSYEPAVSLYKQLVTPQRNMNRPYVDRRVQHSCTSKNATCAVSKVHKHETTYGGGNRFLSDTAALMRTTTEMRNAAEYQDKTLSAVACRVA
jgi:hypothetical protein